MNKYLLPIFTFLFSVFLSFSLLAQGKGGGNNGGNKYQILGNQQPCIGSLETYTITPHPGNNAIDWKWEPPRADGDIPWVLESLSDDKTKATFRVGDKPGTVKATPIPGTINVETLPVHPGRELQISINGSNAVCASTQQVYKLVVNNLGNGNKGGKNISLDDLDITWNVTGFTVVSGQNSGTLTVSAAPGFTGGTVSVSVNVPGQNSGPGNNGRGVGPITGFCGGTVNASLQVGLGNNCVPPCPATTVSIAGPTSVCPTPTDYELDDLPVYTAQVTNGNASLTYGWEVPTGWQIVSGTGSNTIRVRVGTTPGSVKVSVNNNCATSPATATQAIIFSNNCPVPTSECPATTVAITGPGMVCPAPEDFSRDDLVTYVAEVTNGTSDLVYDWDVPAGWQIIAGASSDRVQVRVGNMPGQVSVKVTNNCSGSASASRLIAFGNNCPVPTSECPNPTVVINGPGSVCANQAQLVKYTASVTNQGMAAVTYNWTVSPGWQIVSGHGTNEIEVKVGSTTGEVALTLDNDCGSKATASRNVELRTDCDTPPTCQAPTVTIEGPASICAFQDEPVTFTAKVTNTTSDITYNWEVPEDWFILSQTGPTLVVSVGFSSGPVIVTVTNRCNEATDAVSPLVDENCTPLEPLPVELISFAGESTKEGILLTWSTASEKNNDYFELERSADGKTYAKIGQEKGKGTTNSRQMYTLRDNRASQGTYYYRLKQVDLDGTFTYSNVIAVKHGFGLGRANLVVAPNPVSSGQFTLRLPEAATNAQLQILDLNGRLMATQNLEAGVTEASFSTQNLQLRAGNYIIKIIDGANVSHAKMIVR
ncbi:T9SS type A sorting domain-containing protein [Adhaeribacter rhizoryzae]|uniref:T9SS type A sorting domain-containing protein n=1 Tax=Adhaeribacter rhizoryzae TaxID=2607907 RepID=A0A5M6DMN2_9BACT|nr:T9SS type A sorting domain-containing protein [Adhaeribacter rhizoryzae]KAA5547400.1 T9SS type A sorting domain-containing protein [Adhaeribacter rhizoryzae]